MTSTYVAFFGQVQDIAFLPGGVEFTSAAEVVRRNSTDKGIMVWDFRSTVILSNQIYQVCNVSEILNSYIFMEGQAPEITLLFMY